MLNIENMDQKFHKVVQSDERKELQTKFNQATNIYVLGHGGNFKAYNPHCVEDVEKVSHDFSLLTEVAKHARKDRLFE